VWDLRDTVTDGAAITFCFLNYKKKKEEQSLDLNQEEGWEVQDGSTRVRRVVNSGQQWKREGMRP